MQSYIGCIMVKAEYQEKFGSHGYRVIFPDEKEVWLPKEMFEQVFLSADWFKPDREGNPVSPLIESFIDNTEVITASESTTVVRATLKNGFEITESSFCVNPINYSQKIGVDICLRKIRNHIYLCLGFILQSAKNGFKKV